MAESAFASEAASSLQPEIRHRHVDSQIVDNADQAQADIIVNQQLATVSSPNDLFWSILIASLLSAIILLVLRRLFFV